MNLLPLISDLRIITKNTGVARFGDVMNYAQRQVVIEVEKQLAARKPVRIIVLKARQIGISTVIEAIIFVLAMMIDNLKCMIIAHEMDASEHLLSITTNYWNSFSFKPLYTPRNASQKRLGWRETNTQIQITTAKNVDTGRSRTIHALHASEVAFWLDPNTLMTGLGQCIPEEFPTLIFLESTANGIGDYFEGMWSDAEAGENEYVPLFFPWHKHPEYRASAINIPYDNLGELDDEEKKLKAEHGVDDDRLAWRRYIIKNKLSGSDIDALANVQSPVDKFHQEYPTTPEEAFLSSGKNVFHLDNLRPVYHARHGHKGNVVREANGRVRFQPDIRGPLTIFKYPSDDVDFGVYMIGGDATRTTRGDPAVAQVINRRTWEQVAVWRGRIDPTSFADVLARLGAYYNNAMLCPETTGPGYATIGALMQMDYPYIWQGQWADKAPGVVADLYGWATTNRRKQWAIGNLLKAVIDKDIDLHHDITFAEMKNYVTHPNGEYGPNTPNGYDDCVMALAIGLTAVITEAHTVPAYGAMKGPGVLEQLGAKMEPVWEQWEQGIEGEGVGMGIGEGYGMEDAG